MKKGRQFEDVEIWQYSKKLAINIYKKFESQTSFNFRNQIERAALSIMNNIAEGLERNSDRELKRFLTIAKGSSGEVRSMLHLANALNMLSTNVCDELRLQATQVSKMLGGFIKSLKVSLETS